MAAAEDNRSRMQIYSAAAPAGEVTPFWREKYEKDARKYWDIFYKRHQDKFFKDRHYLEKEWGSYFHAADREKLVVLEVGCGAGNTIFPLLATYDKLFIHACDFSPRAIDLVKKHKDFTEDQVHAFVCDLVVDDLCKNIPPCSVDIVTMVFFLSAVAPEKMTLVLNNIKKVLKPNGRVLLRDYAAGDLAQERLTSKEQCISENFYVRGDGTRAFYFSIDFLITLFKTSGFSKEEVSLCCKQVENRSLELVMNRRWIQAVFASHSHKPHTGHDIKGGGSIFVKSPEDNLDIDLSESITELFSIFTPVNEVVDINFNGFTFKIRILGKENQHTCRSTGLMLWESARFMSLLLAENNNIVAGKRVLELGCGCSGIFSMVAAQSAKFVVATDGDEKALELLKENVAVNLDTRLVGKLAIARLEWGNKEHIAQVNSLNHECGFEMIIGMDVTYVPETVMPLFETARELMSDGVGKNQKPALVLCHIQRRVDEDSIVLAASQFGFRLVDRFIYGQSGSSGIIGSWFSQIIKDYFLHQKTPLNIMYFEL